MLTDLGFLTPIIPHMTKLALGILSDFRLKYVSLKMLFFKDEPNKLRLCSSCTKDSNLLSDLTASHSMLHSDVNLSNLTTTQAPKLPTGFQLALQ